MFNLSGEEILCAILTFIRIGSVFLLLPMFGDGPTPVRFRVLLSCAFAVAVYPLLAVHGRPAVTESLWPMIGLCCREMVLGLSIGFCAKLMFDGLIMAAGLVGYQMGFGTATLFIPDADQQMDSFTAIHRILIMLFFLALNLHHNFIQAIVQSFILIPFGGGLPDMGLATFFIQLTGSVLTTALQIGAPILVALLFTMAALGLVSRTVPQLNVFTLSFPMSFFIGLMIYIASLPFYSNWLTQHFERGQESLLTVMRAFI